MCGKKEQELDKMGALSLLLLPQFGEIPKYLLHVSRSELVEVEKATKQSQ